MTRKMILPMIVLSMILMRPLAAQESPSASEILAKSDEIRNPQTDYEMNVKITNIKPNRENWVNTYQVMVSGRDKTIVKTLSPAIDYGRITLMLGKDLWVYLPNLAKPLRISLSERLTGEVSNGDISRANFVGDYNPQLVRTEQIGNNEYYVLDLEANALDVTYSKVILWVEQGTYNPFKAEFYAVSGKLLKTCSYEDYRELGGAIRPTRIIMTDALFNNQSSVMEYNDVDIKPIPAKYFTKDYMKKLTD